MHGSAFKSSGESGIYVYIVLCMYIRITMSCHYNVVATGHACFIILAIAINKMTLSYIIILLFNKESTACILADIHMYTLRLLLIAGTNFSEFSGNQQNR